MFGLYNKKIEDPCFSYVTQFYYSCNHVEGCVVSSSTTGQRDDTTSCK